MDWDIPGFYSSAQNEYQQACEKAVIVERSNLGVVQVSGSDHTDLLHRLTTNELRRLKPGEGQINIFTNEIGRIIDRVFLLKNENLTHLITSAANAKKVSEWIEKYIFIEEVEVENLSKNVGALAVIGKNASEVMKKIGASPDSPDWHFQQIKWRDHSLKVQKSGELHVSGFNIVAEKNVLSLIRKNLLESGILPMGQQAYHSLRLESGWPEFGIDFDDSTNAHEAQMLPFLDFNKGCYIGQEVIARLDTYEKVKKYLVGLKIQSELLPEKNTKIFAHETEIGHVTSAGFSFDLNQNIALAYIKTKFIEENSSVEIHTETERIPAIQIKLSFK